MMHGKSVLKKEFKENNQPLKGEDGCDAYVLVYTKTKKSGNNEDECVAYISNGIEYNNVWCRGIFKKVANG